MGRNLVTAFSAGALLISSSLLAADKIDFGKINSNIAEIIANNLSPQSNISNFKFSIDGRGTNIDANQFHANFSATANSTGWSKSPVEMKGFMKVEVEEASKDKKGQIELKRSITFKTDVLAMIKYNSKKLATLCEKDVPGIYGVLLQNECASVPQLEQAASVGDVFSIIKDVYAKHASSLEAIVADGKQNIGNISNVALQQEAEKTLQQANKLLGIIKAAKLEQTKENTYIVSLKDMDFPIVSFLNGVKDLVELDDSQMIMTDSELTFTGEMDLLVGSNVYTAAKPEIVKFMQGLEEGSEGAKQMVAMKMNIILTLMNQKLKQ